MGHFSQLDPLELQPFPDEEPADLGIFGNEGSLFSAAVQCCWSKKLYAAPEVAPSTSESDLGQWSKNC